MRRKLPATNEFHIFLDLAALNASSTARDALITAILKLAPQSPLFSDPAIQAAVTQLQKTHATFTTASQTAAQSGKQHALDVAAALDAQAADNRSLVLLRTLAQNGAKTESDLTSLGFTAYTGRPPPPQLVPPEVIDVKQGRKGSGRARATVRELGNTRRSYAARSTASFPITATSTFDSLPGKGKQRKLTGQPGTTVWVQFALLHGGQQSDWSAPVPVAFP